MTYDQAEAEVRSGIELYPPEHRLNALIAKASCLLQEVHRQHAMLMKPISRLSDEHLADWLNDFDENEAEGRLARRELSTSITERESCHDVEND